MNPFREELRKALGSIAHAQAEVFGDTIVYRDRATDPKMLLRAIPNKETLSLTIDGALQEQHTRRNFAIPRQQGCICFEIPCHCCGEDKHFFPPRFEPSQHAIIEYEGYDWAVESWTCDSVNAMYTAETIRHIARRTQNRP